jgi:hypothetical protein
MTFRSVDRRHLDKLLDRMRYTYLLDEEAASDLTLPIHVRASARSDARYGAQVIESLSRALDSLP